MARHPVVIGILGGAAWGTVLRAWMRFISTDPEFSWSGTLFIVGAAAWAGLIIGVVWWRYLAGGSRWWRLFGIGTLPVFGGAGIVMLPSAILGAVGFGRTRWPSAIRATLVVVAVGGQFALLGLGGDVFPEGRLIPAMAWYTVMIGIQMWALSVLFRP
ncbi:MAG: hypothetical protein WD990_14230, partial [Acidimicrobiia bacterium]